MVDLWQQKVPSKIDLGAVEQRGLQGQARMGTEWLTLLSSMQHSQCLPTHRGKSVACKRRVRRYIRETKKDVMPPSKKLNLTAWPRTEELRTLRCTPPFDLRVPANCADTLHASDVLRRGLVGGMTHTGFGVALLAE